ncbi:MAG: methyltransferase family protein [Nitrospirota bacterium]
MILLIYFSYPRKGLYILGIIIALIGEVLRIWATGHLRKNKEVTTTGPYAYVKNPLYLGTFLIMLGFCIIARNIYILGIGLAIFLFYYAPYKKKREADRLREIFGEKWDDYDKHVPDYIPKLTPYKNRGNNRWNAELVSKNSEIGTLAAVIAGILLIGLKFLWVG